MRNGTIVKVVSVAVLGIITVTYIINKGVDSTILLIIAGIIAGIAGYHVAKSSENNK